MEKHLDEEAIFGLAEGGLDASARAVAEAHLQGCAACRREVEIAAGFFKEIAGLEPVKAPANFLANVRARLPRPSPLRAFVDSFMRPLRIIPMQVALLTILGLTAISSYLYQRGGLNKDAASALSETAAETAAETTSETTSERPEPMAESPASASESVDQPGKSSQPPRPIQKQAGPAQVPSDLEDAAASGRGLAENRAKAKAQGKSGSGFESGSRPDESMRESDSPIAMDRAAPASAPASPKAPVPLSAHAPASRQAAPPAPSVAMEPAPAVEAARAEKPRAAKKAAVQEAVKEKNAGAIGSAELPAFIVRLAPGKRIGDVVSGLKAMGADSLSARSARSAWTAGDSGGKGMDYMFLVPASMRKDIAPYLERYGKVEGAGLLPAAGSAPSRIRIRFLP